MATSDLQKPRRIELILRQLDALPTLPAIAARLLQLTSDDQTHAKQVVELVSADPALTAKLISLCRTADRGVFNDALTVDQAVVLLGFSTVRNTVLSLKVFEAFNIEGSEKPLKHGQNGGSDNAIPFNRRELWHHALAVGTLAEMIAKAHPGQKEMGKDQAFVCGLLHDIGKLAIDQVLPRSYARVVELSKQRRASIAEVERSIIGIDHHTAGKRLAEQWGLPHMIQDCIWLHGSPYEALPNLAHRRMIGLVRLSNTIVRGLMVGTSGNHGSLPDTAELIERLGLSHEAVASASQRLIGELERRARAFGLDDTPSEQVLMRSIQRANESLGRLNQQLDARNRQVAGQSRVLEVIAGFHGQAIPGRSVQDTLEAVMSSAKSLFGDGFYGVLYPSTTLDDHEEWLIGQQPANCAIAQFQTVEPPTTTPDLSALQAGQAVGMKLMGLLPWISDYMVQAEDVRQVQLLPLTSGWGTSAILIHDREQMPAWPVMQPLLTTWGSTIAAAAQHEGAKRLGEDLNQANLTLAEVQDQLLHSESMARLGEMAAGAAHEMNNPLAVIAGRAQLLTSTLEHGSDAHKSARLIFTESHRLSDLITALHTISTPPKPEIRPIEILGLIDEVVRIVQEGRSIRERSAEISMSIRQTLPLVQCDPAMVARALTELMQNAVQSNAKTGVHLTASVDHDFDRVVIVVADDGDGMDAHTLDHAFDPFFSAKTAGRQVGMGLPHAQQLIAAHGGQIVLDTKPDKGTTATIYLPVHGPLV